MPRPGATRTATADQGRGDLPCVPRGSALTRTHSGLFLFSSIVSRLHRRAVGNEALSQCDMHSRRVSFVGAATKSDALRVVVATPSRLNQQTASGARMIVEGVTVRRHTRPQSTEISLRRTNFVAIAI